MCICACVWEASACVWRLGAFPPSHSSPCDTIEVLSIKTISGANNTVGAFSLLFFFSPHTHVRPLTNAHAGQAAESSRLTVTPQPLNV